MRDVQKRQQLRRVRETELLLRCYTAVLISGARLHHAVHVAPPHCCASRAKRPDVMVRSGVITIGCLPALTVGALLVLTSVENSERQMQKLHRRRVRFGARAARAGTRADVLRHRFRKLPLDAPRQLHRSRRRLLGLVQPPIAWPHASLLALLESTNFGVYPPPCHRGSGIDWARRPLVSSAIGRRLHEGVTLARPYPVSHSRRACL